MDNVNVLCATWRSNFLLLGNVSVFTEKNPVPLVLPPGRVVAMPPCAQWSRMRAFSKENREHLNLAALCVDHFLSRGGVLEQPAGSILFRHFGLKPTLSVDQSWFGFPARKRTYLCFRDCEPLPFPLSFDLPIYRSVSSMGGVSRSQMTLDMAQWLVESVRGFKGLKSLQ